MNFSLHKETQSREKCSERTFTATLYCAQLEGVETTRIINPNPQKRRARMTMEHYPCKGKLLVMVNPEVPDTVRIRIEHHLAHQHYIDISLTEEMKDIIEEMKDSPASMVCQSFHFPI